MDTSSKYFCLMLQQKALSILKQDKAGFSALETKIFVEMYDYAKDETFESTYQEWYLDHIETLEIVTDEGHYRR